MNDTFRDQSNDRPDGDFWWFSENNPNRRRNFLIASAIVLVLFIFGCVGLFAIRNRAQAQQTPAIAASVEAPAATEAPAEPVVLQTLPADVTVEKMVVCGNVGEAGKWNDKKAPFTGTEFVCGADKYWDITRMFYNGVEYQVPVTENVAAPAAPVANEPATPAQPEVVIVDYNVPTNAGRLWTEEKGVLGFYADCNVAKPCDIPYPAQSTLIVALGGGTITDGEYFKTFTTDGTIGNVYANVCELQSGSCKATITDFSAGNVRYTIVFAPFEVPTETLAGALNRMGVAPNCGGSGCPTINAYSKNGQETTFKRGDKIEALQVSGLVTTPAAPFTKINLIYGSQPTGAEPIVLNKIEVGSIYYLAETDSFVNVPEGGGTVFYCGANAEIDGKTCKAGTAIRFDGNKSDGSTPDDLNRTVKIVSSESNMIRVYMIYATDFSAYVEKLKADHPDWEWK